MINPSKKGEALNSPVERANSLNDPQFENQQGYFNYDLTHSEYITPLFGKITPSMHLDTVPADRVVLHEDVKTILNRIDGNFLNTINQYSDSFFVSLRSVFPMNYEKLIPNPLKGDDLPNSALPMVPLAAFIMDYCKGDYEVDVEGETYNMSGLWRDVVQVAPMEDEPFVNVSNRAVSYVLSRISLLATVLSRGELLDYLGIQFDYNTINPRVASVFQEKIDAFFDALYGSRNVYLYGQKDDQYLRGIEIQTTNNDYDNGNAKRQFRCNTKEEWRQALADCFEAGLMPHFGAVNIDWDDSNNYPLHKALNELGSIISQIFGQYELTDVDMYLTEVDSDNISLHDGGHINIGKVLAYQQIIAQYFTNDKIDNIFSSELFMQLLRGVMYPSSDGLFTKEPVFNYNGVSTEYDYISAGGFWASLISNEIDGKANRQFIWMTLMLLIRRSLRYGDYFSTARHDMLAVSDQLNIATTGSMVSPIDITKGLLMQRYLNAANYIGQGFLQYMSSEYGVKPSDTGVIPRFISHRKVVLNNQITNNTADEQGKQTTNLVGYTDNGAFDVFIDDFGYILTLQSYDLLPIYKSGIENTYYFADRFDYFNPMLQGIGDQQIRLSELIGNPASYNTGFGWTMRNAEYKYKLSKAHGAFVNSLNGFCLAYPLDNYFNSLTPAELKIDSDFIRDKAIYIDPIISHNTGCSPANYFHFTVACVNELRCARKIQATPSVLF